MKNITPKQYGLLKEIGNIGIGNAATGLNKLLGKKIEITNPKVDCLPLEQVTEYLGGTEQIVSAILFKITGDICGSIMLVFPGDSSLTLLNTWFENKTPITIPLDSFYESALKELSNIATGSYLTALCNLTGNFFQCSIPLLATDMFGALLEEALSEITQHDERIILIDNEFIIGDQTIKGFILLMISPQSMEKIFTKLEAS